MTEGAFADIRAIKDLEDGIRTFGHQMADANSEIERTIDLYFQSFERGLHILEERLRRAEEELERAEWALERQRNKQVWVKDEDGGGHWEQADCSAEEAAVARCRAKHNRWRHDVETCHLLISDAQAKRHIHEELFSQLENGIMVAVDKIGPVKELVEKHLSTSVPSSSPSPSQGSSGSSSSPSSPASSVSSRADMSSPSLPFDNSERVTRDSVSSFREGIKKILNKHKNDDTNE